VPSAIAFATRSSKNPLAKRVKALVGAPLIFFFFFFFLFFLADAYIESVSEVAGNVYMYGNEMLLA
jgi:succinate dehydrogenase hydrophobic anchor subunit